MKKKYFLSVFIIVCSRYCLAFAADEDPFAAYHSDIRKEADAKVISVYDAWSNNMTERIRNGYSDGIVIDEEGDYAGGKVHADGLGNVVVDKDAIVGPIINNTDVNNTTIIMNPKKRY